ncbi:MAG: biotin--[acetyl-CoA-carboxylase] ligase, partial [Planctomycetota bacterium]
QIVDSTTSTNDLAWARVDAPDADGLVVFAEHQTGGRGRFGRTWGSPRGASLLCSVLLVESQVAAEQRQAVLGAQLGLLAAVASFDAIAEATGLRIGLKWPNDLVVQDRKLGGILVESRVVATEAAPRRVESADQRVGYVVGMGLNCLQHRGHFPPELRDRATSLDLVSPGPVDRHAVARALLAQLDRWYADPSALSGATVRRAWLERAAALGSRISLRYDGRRYTGQVVDLDPTASLVVQLDEGGRRLFDAAHATVLPD